MMQGVEDAGYELAQHLVLLHTKTDQAIAALAHLTSENEIHAESPFQHCHRRRRNGNNLVISDYVVLLPFCKSNDVSSLEHMICQDRMP